MTLKLRALVALASVCAAALVALAYERHSATANATADLVLAWSGEHRDLGFRTVAQAGSTDENRDLKMLDVAFEKVRTSYYKPVSDADLLNGELQGLVALLRAKHIVAALTPPPTSELNDRDADETAADNLLREAFAKYGLTVGDDQLAFAAISGMLASLKDPYTEFLDPKENRQLNEMISGGGFGGIGVYIGQDKKTRDVVIIDPIVRTPAFRAGLKPGDVIVSVDGNSTSSRTLDSVMNMIRGPAGSTVRLLIKRKGAADKEYAVVRAQIEVPSVDSRMLDNSIGYIQLFDFGNNSPVEVTKAINSLLSQGAKAFILDLRNNGGGLLRSAVDVSSKFVADGPIVSTIDRRGQVETQTANQDAITPHPLVVMVNQFSASASEITAGAIQDSKAGILVGVKTFGKGVVQTIYDLPGKSAVKITTARYVTPSGRDINKKGIEPNISVPMDPLNITVPGRPVVLSKDVQLKAALGYLKTRLALKDR